MSKATVLICFADTGGGHRAAATATKHALENLVAHTLLSKQLQVKVESVIAKTNYLNNFFFLLYNYLLREHTNWMKYYIGFIEAVKPNQRQIGYFFCKSFLTKLIKKTHPSVVVSVHPMINHYLANTLKDLGLADQTKLIVVVTDPNANLWSGWACREATLTIAPNDLARNKLMEMGVEADKVITVGMPIDPIFLEEPETDRKQTLSDLRLDPDVFTVLLSGGWAGGVSITGIYNSLRKVQKRIQVVILCGHNEDLESEMKEESAKSSIPTAVLPFRKSMAGLMSACDLLITKAGGLTTFEAIARHLPMALDLLTEPMPQEAGTVEILLQENLAQGIREFDDIISIVDGLEPDPDRHSKPLPTNHNLDRVYAIFDIAKIILDQSGIYSSADATHPLEEAA